MLTDNHQSLEHLYHQCVCLITKEVQNTLVQILITSFNSFKIICVFLLCYCDIASVFKTQAMDNIKRCFLYHG